MSLFILCVVFGAIAAAVVLWPVLGSKQPPSVSSGLPQEFGNMSLVDQLIAEREAILQSVRDLDFDYQTGKVLHDDYQTQRESLMQRGVDLSRRIDAQETAPVESKPVAAPSIATVPSAPDIERSSKRVSTADLRRNKNARKR